MFSGMIFKLACKNCHHIPLLIMLCQEQLLQRWKDVCVQLLPRLQWVSKDSTASVSVQGWALHCSFSFSLLEISPLDWLQTWNVLALLNNYCDSYMSLKTTGLWGNHNFGLCLRYILLSFQFFLNCSTYISNMCQRFRIGKEGNFGNSAG